MAEAAGALYGVETLVEGALAFAKGVYNPTLPLKASIRQIKDVEVLVAYGSLSVVGGRGYVFGGIGEGGQLAGNHTHIIHLPTTDFETTDYEKTAPTSTSPAPRCGHSSAVIGSQIYIIGGSTSPDPCLPEAMVESGTVHVFNTETRSWSTLNPATKVHPPPTAFATAVATTEPESHHRINDPNPKFSTARKDLYLKHDLDPSKDIPDIPPPNSFGTLILFGGVGENGDTTNEIWAFDIASRIWSQLPSPPILGSSLRSPNLAIVGNRLYTYTEGRTWYLDLDMRSAACGEGDNGALDLGLSPLGPWENIRSGDDGEDEAEGEGEGKKGPGDRSGGVLVPVTTGQGRNYLLLVGGDEEGSIWTLQLRPDGMSAASVKDAARMAIRKDTKEEVWAEVRYFDTEGRIIQEGQQGRGVDGRKAGFLVAKMGEVDGGALAVWGGFGAAGEVRTDGVLIDVTA